MTTTPTPPCSEVWQLQPPQFSLVGGAAAATSTGTLRFTSTALPVAVANALRRTLMAEAPGWAFGDDIDVRVNDGDIVTPVLIAYVLLQLPLVPDSEQGVCGRVEYSVRAPDRVTAVTAGALGLPVAAHHADIVITTLPPGGALVFTARRERGCGSQHPRFKPLVDGPAYVYAPETKPAALDAAFAEWAASREGQREMAQLPRLQPRALFDARASTWRYDAPDEPAALMWELESADEIQPVAHIVATGLRLLAERVATYVVPAAPPPGVVVARLPPPAAGVGVTFSRETATLAVPLQYAVSCLVATDLATGVGWAPVDGGVVLTIDDAVADASGVTDVWPLVATGAARLHALVCAIAAAWRSACSE